MYGENTRLLRDSLRELLTQHRIQQRIGGAGIHTVPETATVTERQEIGEQIARYRHAVLVWCHQAMQAANPRINLTGTSARTRGPAEELRYRLDAAIKADPATMPTMEELVTGQRFELVDLWRQAARACALAEHDFDAGVGYGRLSEAECMTVIHDAAEITRALVGLDRRYSNIPGWKQLKDPGRLGRAAEVCAAYSGYGNPDYSVDRRDWKPPTRPIDGPGLPGITGVLQAQHNLLLHLEATRRLTDSNPELAGRWQRRAQTYGRLVHQTRDVGGLCGKGGLAAGQGSVAAARMQKLPDDGLSDTGQLRRLMRISAGIDERVCTAVELGIKERLYFQRVTVPAIENDNGDLVTGPRHEWLPITGPVQTGLLAIVHHDLRPTPIQRKPPFLGVPVNTLYQWRHKGTGPVAFRVGRFLRYDAADVRQWLTEHAAVGHGRVEKRERTTAKGKAQVTWRVRWREPDGRARAKSFPRKVDADRFAFTVSADIVRGNYLDPDAGKVLFEEYAAKWLAAQTFEETTRVAVELRLRLHAYPVLGDRFLSDIQPSTIQGWLRGLTELAPTYRKGGVRQRRHYLHCGGR